MGNFNRDSRPSGDRDRGASRGGFGGSRGGFGGGSRGGFGGSRGGFGGDRRDRDSRPAEMHQAVCDGCGNDCEVPFRPTSGKPVYCNDCFKKNDTRPSRSSGGGQDNSQVSEAINGLNKKLDQILNLLQATKAPAKAKTKEKEMDVVFDEVEEKPKAAKKVVKKKK